MNFSKSISTQTLNLAKGRLWTNIGIAAFAIALFFIIANRIAIPFAQDSELSAKIGIPGRQTATLELTNGSKLKLKGLSHDDFSLNSGIVLSMASNGWFEYRQEDKIGETSKPCCFYDKRGNIRS